MANVLWSENLLCLYQKSMFTLTLRQPAASLSELHVRNCFLLVFDAFKKLLYSRRFASLKRQLYIQQPKDILQQKSLKDRLSKLCYIKKNTMNLVGI